MICKVKHCKDQAVKGQDHCQRCQDELDWIEGK